MSGEPITAGGHVRVRPFNTRDTYPEQRLGNDLCQAVIAGNTIYLRGQVAQDIDTRENIAVGPDPHEHGLRAGEADRTPDQGQDSHEDKVVAGGRDAVQVVSDSDPDNHQRTDEGLGSKGPLPDLQQDEKDEN